MAFGNYKLRGVDADVILIAGDSCGVLELGGICFVGTTLWSEITPQHELAVTQTMSDYRWIYFKNKKVPVLPSQINAIDIQLSGANKPSSSSFDHSGLLPAPV